MKERILNISRELALPVNAVTSTLLVYGGKGMGKSTLGTILLEEMTRVGSRWAALDPMGVLWGIRHSIDGKGSGIECLILGGPHGDLPIEPTAGAVVADLVADNDVNVVIDISRKPNGEMWGVGERIKFVTEYGKRLFARQGSIVDGRRRDPLFQLIDEAARFMPQTIRQGELEVAKCMSVWATIVEEGRNIGLGVGLLTQRSARLSKDVAELADIMFAFRTVGPNSLSAVLDWLGEHVPKERIKTMVEIVRSLPVGACLAVSPGWLKHEGVIHIRARETFDSGATPKAGERSRRVSGNGAKPVDLKRYAERMKETIERAEAENPALLRSQISKLKAERDTLQIKLETAAVKLDTAASMKPVNQVPDPKAIAELRAILLSDCSQALRESIGSRLLGQVGEAIRHLHATAENFQAIANEVDSPRLWTVVPRPNIDSGIKGVRLIPTPAIPARPQPAIPAPANSRPLPHAKNGPMPTKGKYGPSTDTLNASFSHPQVRILDALAKGESIGRKALTRTWAAFLASASPKSSAYVNNLGALRSAGMIDYPEQGKVCLTDAGRKTVGGIPQPMNEEELHAEILSMLTNPQQAIMGTLLRLRGSELSRADLAHAAGASPTSSAYVNNLGALRSLGLVDYGTGTVRAREDLFL